MAALAVAITAAQEQPPSRAALLVTNLKAFRQRYGEYPASLEAFAEQDYAIDPFSGRRFAYRRAGDYVFWPRPR